MLDQLAADRPPGADDDVEQVGGQPGLDGELSQSQRGQGRELGGFEHHRVAGRQRRRHLPGGDGQRIVPRGDQSDYPDGFAECHVDASGHRDGVAEKAFRCGCVVAEGRRHTGDCTARIADGHADVARFQLGEGFAVVVDRCCDGQQDLGTELRWLGGPLPLCDGGAGDHVIQSRGGDLFERFDDLFGRGFDDVDDGHVSVVLRVRVRRC